MQEYIDEYKKNGFCIVKGLLPAELAVSVMDDIHKLFYLQLASLKPALSPRKSENMQHDMKTLLDTNVDAYLAAARRGAKLASVTRYLTHEDIVSTVKGLGVEIPTISAEPVFHISSDQLRIPGGYHGFEPHQDWPSIQGSLDCVVAWAPLVQIDESNFPLQVIPGTHRLGLTGGKITDNLFEVDVSTYNEADFVSAVVEPGDVVFMSSWTLHRTGVKDCQGFRISCSNRWENAAEPTFIERGYPCAYKRSVIREFITPEFPTKEQVNEVFDQL